MESPIHGRLRNTGLSYSKGLMPVFEAVVNSIQAIEERVQKHGGKISESEIQIEVIRDEQIELELKSGAKPEKKITAF